MTAVLIYYFISVSFAIVLGLIMFKFVYFFLQWLFTFIKEMTS